jgi:hypothetical protein
MVDSLNAGEGTLEQLSEAKLLGLKLLKMREIVDKTSDNIASLKLEGEGEGSPDYGLIKTLKSRIQTSAKNFVQDTFVGLPAVPSEEEFEKLRGSPKKESEEKFAEEKKKANIKLEQLEQVIIKLIYL